MTALKNNPENLGNIIVKKIEDIKIVDKLYPRSSKSTILIQQYAEMIDSLPPIEINQNNILIDGAHRLAAHKQTKQSEIKCFITEIPNEEVIFLAAERNAIGKYQLTNEDKKSLTTSWYGVKSKEYIIKTLAISEKTYIKWTETKRKDLKEKRTKRVFDLYLQCYTEEKIVEIIGKEFPNDTLERKAINLLTSEFKNSIQGIETTKNEKDSEDDKQKDKLPNGEDKKNYIISESELTPRSFEPQIYNIWSFKNNKNETKHFGNVPEEITQNLLYAYTKPFDIVFDPFGGGGTTIDVCKKWYRRYYVSDINPTSIAIEKFMRIHDITTGLPEDLPTGEKMGAKLVFLDPPYWKQAKGQYTDMKTDLSNMELKEFYESFEKLFKLLKEKIQSGGYVALIIQSTQWLNDKKTEPHAHKIWNIAEKAGFKFETMIHVPYSTQQYNPQQVNYAKEHKIFLELNRELVIFKND